jgi:hypothetical protein
MSFFKSELVRSEIVEITLLQEKVYDNILKYPLMTDAEKLCHIETLEKLLNKQKVLYARLSLSDDPEAKNMKLKIVDSIRFMGVRDGVDVNIIFNNMEKILESMKRTLDKSD